MLKYFLMLVVVACLHTQAQTAFTASCPTLSKEGLFPKLYTCDSTAISPPVQWSNAPAGTQSFAITMHHIPRDGGKHVYMVVYNIPAKVMALPQGETSIGNWGSNTQNRSLAYSPPCSKGPGMKEYIITVYALSRPLDFVNGKPVSMDELLAAAKDNILASSAFTVKYAR